MRRFWNEKPQVRLDGVGRRLAVVGSLTAIYLSVQRISRDAHIMPAISNADRQRRFRERVKHRLASEPNELTRLHAENARLRASIDALRRVSRLGGLTHEQEIARGQLLADLLSPRAWWRRAAKPPPAFMGYTREGWMSAPKELRDYFGLTDTIEAAYEIMQRDLHKHMERRGRRMKHRRSWT